MTFPLTQMDWGFRIADQRGGHLRHAYGLGWHVWDGTRWCPDLDGEVVRVYENVVETAWPEIPDEPTVEARKAAARSWEQAQRKSSMDGALVFAAARLAVAAGKLDPDRNLLNCANGTLNLTTMTLSPHNPADDITKVCRGGWQPDLGETRWSKFVTEILPDPEIRDFVQRLMGVAAYGGVIEHFLPVFWGRGRNGKSTFIEAILHALGDYGIQADAKLFMSGASQRHSTERADLQGVRFAVCMETGEGSKIDAPMTKQLTGGDTVRARKMGRDNIEFEPSHTAVMVTNYRPVIPGDDDALWQRVVLIPFTERFLGTAADKGLSAALRADPDAVITWIVEGWQQYQAIGLEPPAAVRDLTGEYRAGADSLGQFIDQCCHVAESAYGLSQPGVASSALYAEWKAWCQHNGEDPRSNKALTGLLEDRGWRTKRTASGVRWLGVTLLTRQDADQEQ